MLNRLKEIEQKTASVQKHLEEAETFEADGPVLKLAAGIFFDYGQEVICLMSGYDE
nr:peptidoglycan bridge formation glycyltransferase FemA/FemB family protein [Faecalibaculum rodentium]